MIKFSNFSHRHISNFSAIGTAETRWNQWKITIRFEKKQKRISTKWNFRDKKCLSRTELVEYPCMQEKRRASIEEYTYKRYPLPIELHVLMWKIFTRKFVSFFIFWLEIALFESSTFWHTYDKLCDRKCSNIQYPISTCWNVHCLPVHLFSPLSLSLSFYVRFYFIPLITHTRTDPFDFPLGIFLIFFYMFEERKRKKGQKSMISVFLFTNRTILHPNEKWMISLLNVCNGFPIFCHFNQPKTFFRNEKWYFLEIPIAQCYMARQFHYECPIANIQLNPRQMPIFKMLNGFANIREFIFG